MHRKEEEEEEGEDTTCLAEVEHGEKEREREREREREEQQQKLGRKEKNLEGWKKGEKGSPGKNLPRTMQPLPLSLLRRIIW